MDSYILVLIAFWTGQVVLKIVAPHISTQSIIKSRGEKDKRKTPGAQVLDERTKSKYTYSLRGKRYFYYEVVLWTGSVTLFVTVLGYIAFQIATR